MSQSKRIADELQAKRDAMAAYFDSHRVDGELKMTMAEVEHARQMNDELTDISKKYDAAVEVERIDAELKAAERIPVNQVPYPGAQTATSFTVTNALTGQKSLGEMFVNSAEYKRMSGRHGSFSGNYTVEFPDVDVKTTMTTSAGFAPESLRSGIVIPSATRQLRVADLIPQGSTSQAAVKYMRESTFTNAAAERAENAALAESALAYSEVTSSVVSLGTFIPATEEQLDDVQGMQSLINNRLLYMVGLREDGQLLNGDGTGANLTGILATSGIQTQARGSDTNHDAIYKAIVACAATGFADADAVVIHPANWQTIRLTPATGSGVYLWGNPSEAGPERIWGLPVVVTTAIASGKALVGAYRAFSHVSRRQGVAIEVGFINDDFTKLKKSIRAVERISLEVYRPSAFCQVTSLN